MSAADTYSGCTGSYVYYTVKSEQDTDETHTHILAVINAALQEAVAATNK